MFTLLHGKVQQIPLEAKTMSVQVAVVSYGMANTAARTSARRWFCAYRRSVTSSWRAIAKTSLRFWKRGGAGGQARGSTWSHPDCRGGVPFSRNPTDSENRLSVPKAFN